MLCACGNRRSQLEQYYQAGKNINLIREPKFDQSSYTRTILVNTIKKKHKITTTTKKKDGGSLNHCISLAGLWPI